MFVCSVTILFINSRIFEKVFSMETEHAKFKEIIYGLEKDVMDIKKEILERDQTIEEKEKRIFQLKSKNQELEKFKFILDFKIKELKSQIEPRERTIQEQVSIHITTCQNSYFINIF